MLQVFLVTDRLFPASACISAVSSSVNANGRRDVDGSLPPAPHPPNSVSPITKEHIERIVRRKIIHTIMVGHSEDKNIPCDVTCRRVLPARGSELLRHLHVGGFGGHVRVLALRRIAESAHSALFFCPARQNCSQNFPRSARIFQVPVLPSTVTSDVRRCRPPSYGFRKLPTPAGTSSYSCA